MKTIVFTAQAFGMGPISKAISIAENINNVKKVFFGTSVAYDFATVNPFDEVYCLGHNNQDEIFEILQKADLFINVMDFPLGKLAKEADCPYFLIDSLLYFWPSIPKNDIALADIYFCQNFFDDLERKIKENNLSNARLIGPIICENFTHKEKIASQVIINFGGIENPYVEIGKNSNYPFIMLDVLLPILKEHFNYILVTGRKRIMDICNEKYKQNTNVRFEMLDQKAMLEELYRSEALFTSPGIQTFFDAHDKLPIFCLLPQNNSNVKNLDILFDCKAIQHCLRWQELYEFGFDSCKNQEENIELILRKLRIFEKSESDQRKLKERIEKFLNSRYLWPNLVRQQKEAVAKLGSNGVKTIISTVNHILLG